MSIDRPKPFLVPFAENGKRFDVPDNNSDTAKGKANLDVGFPEITMRSVMNGGVPPWGQDHNGILHRITKGIQWTQAGGLPVFNQEFCNAIGGYSRGQLLQGNDPSRPWVLWLCVQDDNKTDPNNNKINVAQPQNGWVRYPVISGAEGSILYFDEEGRLEAASPTITTEKWVSSSVGNDDTGKGTEELPYYSIDKAISDTPGSGAVTIYLKAQDSHWYSPKGQAGAFKGWLYMGSRKVRIRSYNDPVLEDALIQASNRFSDGSQGYCVEQITRPNLIITWDYHSTTNAAGDEVVTNTQYNSVAGVSGDFSVEFLGINFIIDRVDELSNSGLPLTTGWAQNGGTYRFIGCTFEKLPYNDHYFLGGGGDFNTTYNFPYSNFFKEDLHSSTAKIIGFPSNLTMTCIASGDSWEMEGTDYTIMANNALTFLSNSSFYHQDSLKILNTPSKRYAYIHPNFEIK